MSTQLAGRGGKLTYELRDGWWTDAGTFESLLRAGNLVARSAGMQSPVAEMELK